LLSARTVGVRAAADTQSRCPPLHRDRHLCRYLENDSVLLQERL